MYNDNDIWTDLAIAMGGPSGSFSESSGGVAEDVGHDTAGIYVQDETPTTDPALVEKLQSMVDRFVSKLEKENWENGGYYVSDVYACESVPRAEGLAKKLADRAGDFRRGLIGIAIHGNHVHTIHNCAYSNKSCRCGFKNFPEAQEDLRRLLRKPKSVETFTRDDWKNITEYFCTKGRRATYFKINGVVQGLPSEITSLSNAIVSGQAERGSHTSLEDCDREMYDNDQRGGRIPQKDTGATRTRKRRGVPNAGGPGGIRGVPGVILDIIQRYAVCPLSEIVYTREYLENQIALKRLDDRDVKNAIDCHAGIINTWSREDYIKFYSNPNTVKIWSARSIDLVDLYYLDYDSSISIVDTLITYQCGEKKLQFVKDLIDVVDMNIPKCNCLLIVSPPSAGKNFLIDAVKDYFLNVGQMQNPNKYNTFAYQDCHNRRLLIWNEPNYEPRETENLKMLFGGDNLSANVKCKPQANVKRTPVICMSNTFPRFANNEAFADRVITYFWNAAPFLKEINKKPRPDAVMDYFYSIYNGQYIVFYSTL